MKKEHPHAQVLRWIADGETVQARNKGSQDEWVPFPKTFHEHALAQLVCGHEVRLEFRIKPKTRTVGDREIEAPVMSGPGYFITDIGTALQWFGDHRDTNSYFDMQKNGRVFASIEAARAAQEAITALLTREPS